MSVAQTWFGRSTFTPRSRYGIDLVAGRGFRGVAPAIDRLDSHALHQGRDMPAADRDALAVEKIAQHAGARERALQMQFVDPPHERAGLRARPGAACNRPRPG